MPMELTIVEEFKAPPARVFAAITDLDAAREWMPGFLGIERLTPAPFAPGTAWRESRKMFGMTATEHFEVKRVEPGELVELYVDGAKGSSRKGWYRFTYELSPAGNGTRLVLRGEIGGNDGFVARLLGKLMIGTFRKALARDLSAMKAHLERSP